MDYLIFFITVSLVFIYYDIRYREVPDKIILPAIVVGILIIWNIGSYSMKDLFFTASIVFLVFIILLATPFPFGGGDLRYAVFCVPLIGMDGLGWFIFLSGLFHLVFLLGVKRSTYAFVPAMFISALLVNFMKDDLWTLIGV